MTIRTKTETFRSLGKKNIYLIKDRGLGLSSYLYKAIDHSYFFPSLFRFEMLYGWHDMGIYSKGGTGYPITFLFEKHFPGLDLR